MHKGEPQGDHHRHAEDDQDGPADHLSHGAKDVNQMSQLAVSITRSHRPRQTKVNVRQVMYGTSVGRHHFRWYACSGSVTSPGPWDLRAFSGLDQTTKAQPSQEATGRFFRRPSRERCSSSGRNRTGSSVRTSISPTRIPHIHPVTSAPRWWPGEMKRLGTVDSSGSGRRATYRGH